MWHYWDKLINYWRKIFKFKLQKIKFTRLNSGYAQIEANFFLMIHVIKLKTN
jgi:hypothetical protein